MLKRIKSFILNCIIHLNRFWFDVRIFYLNTFFGERRWYLKDYDSVHKRSFYHKFNGVEYIIFYKIRNGDLELFYLYDMFWLRPLLEWESEKFVSEEKLVELIYEYHDDVMRNDWGD